MNKYVILDISSKLLVSHEKSRTNIDQQLVYYPPKIPKPKPTNESIKHLRRKTGRFGQFVMTSHVRESPAHLSSLIRLWPVLRPGEGHASWVSLLCGQSCSVW